MNLKDDLRLLPAEPGIYKMFNKHHEIIYIGKAKNLKNRVRSYFKAHHDDIKTTVLVRHIAYYETIVTLNEKDALILENQLIKKFKPRYNILLKDDKTYPYIKITTNEPFPKIVITRNKFKDRATYFGPYPSIGSTRKLKRLLYDLFPIRDCKKNITLTEKQPKCLLLDIEKCIGPCIYKDIKPQYNDLVKDLKQFLGGKQRAVLSSFKQKMAHHSHLQEYEKAAHFRDCIERVQHLMITQQVTLLNQDNVQVWAYFSDDTFHYMTIQIIVDGKLLFQHGYYETLSTIPVEDFIDCCYVNVMDQQSRIPDYFICEEVVGNVLTSHFNISSSAITIPQKGDKKAILAMAAKNSEHGCSRLHLQALKKQQLPASVSLQQQLSLSQAPSWILGFDISHLQGKHIVASSVSFKNEQPDKAGYRKFNIKTVSETSNDPASMYEVVYRRLRRCKEDHVLPDLILIDGGKAQLNFALKALYQLDLQDTVNIVALAKRNEELYLPKQPDPIIIKHTDPGLQLLQRVRDESHRFAVSFQRQKRSKAFFVSQLNGITGLGTKRINTLLQHYSDLESLRRDTIEDIQHKTHLPEKIISDLLKLDQ